MRKQRQLTLKKGDAVSVAIIKGSNAARYRQLTLDHLEDWTFSGDIISVGRKYVTVQFANQIHKFDKENNYCNVEKYGGSDYILYPSLDTLIEELKTLTFYQRFENFFKIHPCEKFNPLSLDQLERIQQIIDESSIKN